MAYNTKAEQDASERATRARSLLFRQSVLKIENTYGKKQDEKKPKKGQT